MINTPIKIIISFSIITLSLSLIPNVFITQVSDALLNLFSNLWVFDSLVDVSQLFTAIGLFLTIQVGIVYVLLFKMMLKLFP